MLVDHITAETALVLPVADIAARGHAHGALILVDGGLPLREAAQIYNDMDDIERLAAAVLARS